MGKRKAGSILFNFYTTMKCFLTLEHNCMKGKHNKLSNPKLCQEKTQTYTGKLMYSCCYYCYLLRGLVMEKGIWTPTIKI